MPFQVIDRNGRTLTLDDDEAVPDGCRLMVAAMFMDAQRRFGARRYPA